jgi:ATP-dependent Zn protease
MGAERSSGVNSDGIRRHISYYEGGKSLVAALTPEAEPIHKVTILERGTNMGHTAQVRQADEDKTSENYREMLAKLDTRLGQKHRTMRDVRVRSSSAPRTFPDPSTHSLALCSCRI